jgi:putative membrane protein
MMSISVHAFARTAYLRKPLSLATIALALVPVPALAHAGHVLTEGAVWSSWQLTPDIVIPTVLLVLVYGRGVLRRAVVAEPAPWWRPAMFFAGLAAVFLALQSPIDSVAEHLFFVHQIQHLLLRMIGPMLIALALPQGVLVAGLPTAIRRTLLAPIVANGVTRGVLGTLAHPVPATVIFISALYVWEIPHYHNIALLNEPIHYVMHVTMLLAGLVFWWRIFDRRSAPQGWRYGVRLMVLWLVILSNIVLGAYTTLKSTVLYHAYDVLGRLFDYTPLADERLGGIIIWIPSSMMCLVAMLIVIHMWVRHETVLDEKRATWSSSNSEALLRPTSASQLIKQQKSKNRTLALGFAAFACMVFASAVLVGVLSSLSSGTNKIEASHGQTHHASLPLK